MNLLASLFLTTLLAQAAPPAVVAHRGASAEAPENTMTAFRLGWEQGDAVELDVRLTKDGRLAAMHDKTVKRTTGLNRAVVDLTMAELKALDAGRWKGARWAGEPVPELSEVVAAVPERKRLVIELKEGPGCVPELARVLAAHPKTAPRCDVIAFDRATAAAAKRAAPGAAVYWLVSAKNAPPLAKLVAAAKADGLDGLDLDRRFPIDAVFVRTVHEAGLKLWVYTVNKIAEARALAEAGVDGITTDRPAQVAAALR